MILTCIVGGYFLGFLLGFKKGIGEWKVLAALGMLCEFILGATLVGGAAPMTHSDFGEAVSSLIGGFLLGDPSGTLVSLGRQPRVR